MCQALKYIESELSSTVDYKQLQFRLKCSYKYKMRPAQSKGEGGS